MSEKFKFKDIRREIIDLNGNLHIDLRTNVARLVYGGKEGDKPFRVTPHKGVLGEEQVYALAGELKRLGMPLSKEQIYANLTKGQKSLRISNFLILICSVSLIFFSLVKLSLTGFVAGNLTNSSYIMGNISNSTAEIGIFASIIGLLMVLIWKLKNK